MGFAPDDDRARLTDWAHAIEEACARQRLRLHPWNVVPTRGGIGFLGFRILPGEVRVKRTSVNRAMKRLALRTAEARANPAMQSRLAASLVATFAHWKHGDTYRLREKTLRELGLFAGEPIHPLTDAGSDDKEPEEDS